jgi:hypothetical protein
VTLKLSNKTVNASENIAYEGVAKVELIYDWDDSVEVVRFHFDDGSVVNIPSQAVAVAFNTVCRKSTAIHYAAFCCDEERIVREIGELLDRKAA